MSVLAVYREPFGMLPVVRRLPDGETLDRMVARMPDLPEDFVECGVICLNGHPVGRPLWGMIKPRAPAITEVTFHYPPQGGGGGGKGKNLFAMIASIALTVVSGGIASGTFLGGLTGAVAGAPTVLSLALAAGVSLVGSLLISALIPPPSVGSGGGGLKSDKDKGTASAVGNVLAPNAPIPRVVGERKVFPPMAAETHVYYDRGDEVVEAAYVLAGPHRLADIRIGATEITSMPDVEVETREGWPGDAPITLLTRQTRTEPVQTELRGHVVDGDDGFTLETAYGDLSNSLPQVHVVATRERPDRHDLQLLFPQGLSFKASDTDIVRVPFRIRMREVGTSTWINLPEIHFRANGMRQMRATISLVFTDDASTSPGTATSEGWYEARVSSPDQAVDPAGGGWTADSYFVTAGDGYMTPGNLGSTGVDHTIMDRYTATFYLDRTTFAGARHEVEIQRGMAFLHADYVPADYTISGTVRNLFGYYGTPARIAQTRSGMVDTVYLVRSVSVWDEHPLPSRDLAIVAVKARNRQLDAVSVVAGGYVPDWDGTGWYDWAVTDNPAPHLRDILVGAENPDPVPEDLIDDAELVAWRSHCTTKGYTCNALVEDQTLDDAARIVASCGYARPRMSDTWGVVTDYDRSAEAPVQIFTPRNSADFQWTKGFANVPDGFRVNFVEAIRDYDRQQISVFRPGRSNDNGRMEQVTYEGIVTEADARRRASYDQAQAAWRNVFYSWTAPAEAIACRRGDLIGFQHHMLTRWSGAGRIVAIETDGNGDVVAVVLDDAMPGGVGLDMLGSPDLLAEPDLLALGMEMGAAIRREGGAVTVHPVDDVTDGGQRVEFSPPLDPADLTMGCLVVFGPVGQEMLRLVVSGITPHEDFTATITAVDEAPQLWEMMANA